MDLQWYQWVGLAVTALGLSPVPWVTMVLTRRLMPLSAHLERVGDLKASQAQAMDALKAAQAEAMQALKDQHARELNNAQQDLERVVKDRDFERQATRLERDRADAAVGKLSVLTEGFGKVAVGLLGAGEKRFQGELDQ